MTHKTSKLFHQHCNQWKHVKIFSNGHTESTPSKHPYVQRELPNDKLMQDIYSTPVVKNDIKTVCGAAHSNNSNTSNNFWTAPRRNSKPLDK